MLSVLPVDCGGAVSNGAHLQVPGYIEEGDDFHR